MFCHLGDCRRLANLRPALPLRHPAGTADYLSKQW